MTIIYAVNFFRHALKGFYKNSSTLMLFVFMTTLANSQVTPPPACNFLTRKDVVTTTNGAEIPAYDPASKRLFVVAGSVVEFYTINAAGKLTRGGELPAGFTPPSGTTAVPNSVAVNGGVLAASYAIVSTTTQAQQRGRISFYNAATGAPLKWVEVGYLPDMITFTPDGKNLLSADEGEPNSYNQATSFDPEGSISIIDLSNGVAQATVQTAGFAAYNSQVTALRSAGVRIYGPNASVAQDLEPEYIAISPDGKQAWITLQENNAFAVVDIASATVLSIKALGLKNHNQPTVTGLETYTFTNMPVLGTTAAGQPVPLGGFSGLTFEGYAANGNLKFITHTDRGPNGEPTGIYRPFLLPNFTPEIIRFEVDRSTGGISITQRLPLKRASGVPLTGLPNLSLGANANQPYNDEIPVDLRGNPIENYDPLGADLEGIVVAPDGTFWMVDEYRPSIYHLAANGVLIERFVPAGTAAAAGQPAGTYGTESLPALLAQRRQNRGFEAIAYQDGKIYAFVQSPLRNPASLGNAVLNGLQNIRIIEFDPVTKTTTRQFIYRMDNIPAMTVTDSRADKIGDAVAISNGEFLVLERDDDATDSDPLNQIQKKIYRFSLSGATDVSALPLVINGKTLDQMTETELKAAGVNPIRKHLHIDLPATGYNNMEKVEGLTIIDRNTLAVINDNDFTVAGITIDPETGTFTPDPNAEDPVLGIITLRSNELDGSDRDNMVNIRNWPVSGMYQPDAIASFTAAGQTYYITANEGDARDYPGFSEEIRVGATGYVLDPAKYPDPTALKQAGALGRLNVSRSTGDTDNDGDFDQVHVFGARSFSIWNSAGVQVYDSGDELERLTNAFTPGLFNSEGATPSFDTRSDNKGPEPEGVAIGVINGVTYAFIGLERSGDVMVYNVSDPAKPVFMQYINTPEDRGVEGLIFITAENSPTGKPLLVTTAENSLTVSLFEVNVPTIQVNETSGVAVNDAAICEGATVTLTASGDGPFVWSNGATGQSISVTPAESTTYQVTACTLTATQSITVNPVPACSITAIPENNIFTGGVPTNLYLGYGPQRLTLQVTPPKSSAPYSYQWTGEGLSNQTVASPVFTATRQGTFVVTAIITNKFGCSSTCSITITVTDIIVPGTKGKKAYICLRGKTGEIALPALHALLENNEGNTLGRCGQEPGMLTTQQKAEQALAELESPFTVTTLSNPSPDFFTFQIRSNRTERIHLHVMDMTGKQVFSRQDITAGTIRFGQSFTSGLYVAEVVQGNERIIIKLVKQ